MSSFTYRPPERDRKIKMMHAPSPSRAGDRALAHMEKGWLPVNTMVLNRIKEKTRDGVYEFDRSALVRDIKTDPGIYLDCLRRMPEIAERGAGPSNIAAVLGSIDHATLQKFIAVSEKDISIHHTRTVSKAQALRLQHTIISAHSAETMAAGREFSSEDAYAAAVIRQLGLNLIAWNYPEIYSRALARKRAGKGTLEEEIERLLGVAPRSVGEHYARQWHVSPAVRQAVASRTIVREDPQAGAAASLKLSDLCGLAELFAEANDPEYFPEACDEWSAKEAWIKREFGPQFVSTLRERVAPALEAGSALAARPMGTQFFPLPSEQTSAPGAKAAAGLFLQNHYALRCTPAIKECLQAAYEHVDAQGVCINALRHLADVCFTELGFQRGCLYLLKEGSLDVQPSLRFGDKPIAAYSKFRLSQNNLITTSIDTAIPVMQTGLGMEGVQVVRICGGLGSKRTLAALYVELRPGFFEDSMHDPLLYFHALRMALRHFLRMQA